MADLNICRVCLVHINNETLFSIYDSSKKIATEIWILTGVQVVEFRGYDVPGLICENCLRDLKNAMKFRNRCRQSDLFFRNFSSDVEDMHWNKKLILGEELEDEPIMFEEFLEIDHEVKDVKKIENDHFELSEDETFGVEMLDDTVIEDKNEPNNSLVCSYCQMKLSTPKTLSNHMIIKHNHNVKEFFSCQICNRNFPLQKSYNRHMREVHGDTKPITCSICNKIFISELKLMMHLDTEHFEEGQVFECKHCLKSFPTRHKHRRHVQDVHIYKRKERVKKKIKKEDLERNFGPCSTCGKFMTSPRALVVHEQTHIAYAPHEYLYCDLCGHKFKKRAPLQAHIIQRHVQKIRYPCPDCPDRHFSTKYALKSHVNVVHKNIRNFRCEMCGKGFGQRDHLTAHIRIHTGEKPFQCQYCEKRYTHKTDYIRHTWSHTGGRRFTCKFCKEAYKTKDELRAHDCMFKLQA